MNWTLLAEFAGAIVGTGIITSIVGSFLNRRKNKIDIADTINQMASRLADDQRGQIEILNEAVQEVKGDNAKLKLDYAELKAENQELKTALAELQRCNEAYREQAELRKAESIVLKRELDHLDRSVRGL